MTEAVLLYSKAYPIIPLAAAFVLIRLAYLVEDLAYIMPAWRVMLSLTEWLVRSMALIALLLFLFGL